MARSFILHLVFFSYYFNNGFHAIVSLQNMSQNSLLLPEKKKNLIMSMYDDRLSVFQDLIAHDNKTKSFHHCWIPAVI